MIYVLFLSILYASVFSCVRSRLFVFIAIHIKALKTLKVFASNQIVLVYIIPVLQERSQVSSSFMYFHKSSVGYIISFVPTPYHFGISMQTR